MFRKKIVPLHKVSCTSTQLMQVCRNQNGCQLVTSFFDDPHKLFILSGLCDSFKNNLYFGNTAF